MTWTDEEGRPARTPRTDELPALLAELEETGETVARFAERRGLTPWKLYDARRRAKSREKRQSSAVPDLVPVRVVDDEPHVEPLEILLAGGHRLRISAGFDEALLRRVMKVLGSC